MPRREEDMEMEGRVLTAEPERSAPNGKRGGVPEERGAAEGLAAMAERLLVMAEGYRQRGAIWQAMDLYWKVIAEFPDTAQSAAAREVLMTLALHYEREGHQHLARSLYERLL